MRRLIALLALLPCLVLADEQSLSCYVVGVGDGDTLSCFDPERRKAEKIRLRGIDAPESKQPFGQRSKQSLSQLAHGQPATVKWSKRDRWGRIIGAVWVEPVDCPGCGHTLDVGRAQLSVGMAWWFRRYANEQPDEERKQYKFEEREAKVRGIGLWQDKDPVAPWEWRRR